MNIRWSHTCTMLVATLLATAVTGSSAQSTDRLTTEYAQVDPNKPVLCLKPGRVRKLGGRMIYQERRKPEQLLASECEIRGGEYTLYDRANSETALQLWLAIAEQGDAQAQVNVGEIYEKGWIDGPDYTAAFRWYSKAAEQGHHQAERRLAFLYENGLGVDVDMQKALTLWRKAMQLEEELVPASTVELARQEDQRKIDRLLNHLEEQNLVTARLQKSLQNKEAALFENNRKLLAADAEIASLASRIGSARTNGRSAEELVALEQQLEDREAQIQSLRGTVELLEIDVDSRSAQLASSIKRAELKGSELARARERIADQSQQTAQLTAQLKSRNSEAAAMEKALQSARETLAEIQQREAQLSQKVAASSQERDASKQDTRTLQLELATARRDVSAAQDKVATLLGKLESQQSRHDAELAAAKEREQQVVARVASSAGERQILENKLREVEQQSQQLATELSTAREALVKAQAGATTLAGKVAEVEEGGAANIERLQAQLKDQQDIIAKLSASRDGVQSRWKNAIAQRDGLRGQLQSQVEQRDLVEIELETTRSRLNAATADVRKLDSALQQAEIDKQYLRSTVARLEEDLSTSQSRTAVNVRDIERELGQARDKLAGLDSNSSMLQQERSRARNEVELVRDQQQTQLLAMRGLSRKVETLPLSRSGKVGPYRAVIIANYDYSFLPDLRTPRFDAVRLKRLLEDKFGFEVEVQTNLNRAEMFKTLNRVRHFSEKDFVLVYYAGHGKMDDFGDGYWLPTDYSEDDPLSEAISNSDITQTLNQSPAKHLLLVADSCYSGALLRRGNPMASIAVPSLMKFWLENKSRTVLTSGGLQPVLDAGPDNNSVFASALLSALSSSNGAFNGEMLHAAMHDRVVEEAARLGYMDQKPQFAAIDDAGHENGQFVFTPRG